MPDKILKRLSQSDCVEAIALGGSRAGTIFDEKSDYDVYVYVTAPIEEEVRREILSESCSFLELGNHFWEFEDNCVLKSGIDMDILYRNLDEFCETIENVVVRCQPSNSYTTCMWHNLLHCKILYDRDKRLTAAREKYDVPYPKELKKAIIDRQLKLLDSAMPAYRVQIEKAVRRGDLVGINHRVTEFMASYFDLLFARNEQTHPGEKRLIELCKKNCDILPENFEGNIRSLFSHMYQEDENRFEVMDDIDRIIQCVRRIIE